MSRRGRNAAALAAVAVAMALVAGCGGGDSGAGGGSPTTLRLWHYESPNSAMGVAWKEAIRRFEATHAGVRVALEEKGFEQIQKTAPMVLNSDDAPDILEYNKGNATAGLLARQGLLTDLTPEVTERGWDALLGPSVQTTCRYDAGGVMGSGNWYGVPNYAEFLQVFYNADVFAAHGVAVPTTMDEFTAAMDTFTRAGITPLANAGAEYLAQHYLYQLALSKADRDWVNAYERYTGKVDFHDPAWTFAANTFADWVGKGYLAEESVNAKAEDAGRGFIAGRHPMMFSGSWWAGRLEQEVTGFRWGSFLWPESALTLGSGGNMWVVPAKSKAKDLAYDFIDITMSKDIQVLLGNSGGVPVAVEPREITSPKATELIRNYQQLARTDGLAFYPDWPVPGFYDVLVSNTQKLINGSASPDEVLDALQRAYDAGKPAP